MSGQRDRGHVWGQSREPARLEPDLRKVFAIQELGVLVAGLIIAAGVLVSIAAVFHRRPRRARSSPAPSNSGSSVLA